MIESNPSPIDHTSSQSFPPSLEEKAQSPVQPEIKQNRISHLIRERIDIGDSPLFPELPSSNQTVLLTSEGRPRALSSMNINEKEVSGKTAETLEAGPLQQSAPAGPNLISDEKKQVAQELAKSVDEFAPSSILAKASESEPPVSQAPQNRSSNIISNSSDTPPSSEHLNEKYDIVKF